MSDAGPGPGSFKRPRWLLPVALLGALLILVGVALSVDWNGAGDEPGPQITGTTQPA
jgi:hypothetical protein